MPARSVLKHVSSVLCHIWPQRARCQDDGKLCANEPRMRGCLLDICSIDVYGQPICKAVLQSMRWYLWCMCSGVWKAQCWALQKMCTSMPQVCSGMQAHVYIDRYRQYIWIQVCCPDLSDSLDKLAIETGKGESTSNAQKKGNITRVIAKRAALVQCNNYSAATYTYCQIILH